MSEQRRASKFANIEDARHAMHRRLPRFAARKIEGGSAKGVTLHANTADYDQITLNVHVGRPTPSVDLKTTAVGAEIAMPVMLAPVGGLRTAYWDADRAAARAAGKAGTGMVISSSTGTPIEETAAAASGPLFYQLHYFMGRETAEPILERAAAVGCKGIVVTMDSRGRFGGREWSPSDQHYNPRDNKVSSYLRTMPQLLARPGWFAEFLTHGHLRNLEVAMAPPIDGKPLLTFDLMKAVDHSPPVWDDIPWIRERWNGPLIIKGIMTVEDAREAVDRGADAIVVSNHGAMVLDGSPSTISVLPRIAAAVGDECEVWIDGGLRRGNDVVKALALGARVVLVGRAYAFGLLAAGEPGVARCLQLLRQQIDATLRNIGCSSIHELSPENVNVPAAWVEDGRVPAA